MNLHAPRALLDRKGRAPGRAPLALLLGLFGPASCAPAAASGPVAAERSEAPPPAARSEEPALRAQAWGQLENRALGLRLRLPEVSHWQSRPARESWELSHVASGSKLTVRRWRAGRIPRPEACRRELALRAPALPQADEATLVDRRKLDAPLGFATSLEAFVLAAEPPRPVHVGYVVAVGAAILECFAFTAQIESRSDDELAERLSLFVSIAEHIERLQVDDRIPSVDSH